MSKEIFRSFVNSDGTIDLSREGFQRATAEAFRNNEDLPGGAYKYKWLNHVSLILNSHFISSGFVEKELSLSDEKLFYSGFSLVDSKGVSQSVVLNSGSVLRLREISRSGLVLMAIFSVVDTLNPNLITEKIPAEYQYASTSLHYALKGIPELMNETKEFISSFFQENETPENLPNSNLEELILTSETGNKWWGSW